jgi:5-methylcytosine-specific restriction protein A
LTILLKGASMSAEQIAEQATELAAILAAGPEGSQLVDAVRRTGQLRRLIDAIGVELAGQIELLSSSDREKPLARQFSEKSACLLVQAYAGLDFSEASAWCRVGAALQPRMTLQGEVLPQQHEALATALAEGRMRVAGADRVLCILDEIAPYASVDQLDQVEAMLVSNAPDLTDRQFARLCRSVPERFLPDDAQQREQYLREQSGVLIRRTHNGLVKWVLTMHPEAAGFLQAAVDARTAPRRQPTFSDPREPVETDFRPLHQKRLDAVVSIARESLAHDHGSVAGTSVTMQVTVPLEVLRTGLGTAKIVGIDEPISAATARRLAADAEIIPVVLGGPSEPLDMGRAVRLSTEPQRRALAIRDGGCIWPTCDAPPGWCEVAHIVPWALGGGTDLDNLMLLCPFHHRCFDNDSWQLEHRDGERYLVPPPWVDSARTPRRVPSVPVLAA